MRLIYRTLALTLTLAHCSSYSIITPRSQTVDAPRWMVGHSNQVYVPDECYANGTMYFVPEYTRSIRPDALAQALFGTDCLSFSCNPAITISGSQSKIRSANDWLADYFALPTDYHATIKLEPLFEQFLFDLGGYIGLDNIRPGMFFRIHAPIVHARTSLNYREFIDDAGTNAYPAGYFSPDAISRDLLLNSFEQYVDGMKPTLNDNVVFEPLRMAQWETPVSNRFEKTGVSDIEAVLGWNFILNHDYRIGIGGVVRAPTGNRITGDRIFEPIIGNGGHWELGGMVTGSWNFWNNEETARGLSIWVEGYFTTLLSNTQCRTLNLKHNGCSSKYMLAQRIQATTDGLLFGRGSNTPGGPTVDTTQLETSFTDIYTPVANLTSVSLDIKHALQADIAAMLTYQSCGVTWDIGYDFWCLTKPIFTKKCSSGLSSGLWALKGDAFVYGFGATDAVNGANQAIALAATQSTATIHAGTNRPIGTAVNIDPASTNNQQRNPGIDNPEFGVTSANVVNTTDRINYAPGLVAADLNQQRISVQPVMLTENDLDLDGECKQLYSNRFFTHLSYTWQEENWCWVPYVGLGGFVEIARSTDCCDSNDCYRDTCAGRPNSAISQWGIWCKVGVAV